MEVSVIYVLGNIKYGGIERFFTLEKAIEFIKDRVENCGCELEDYKLHKEIIIREKIDISNIKIDEETTD